VGTDFNEGVKGIGPKTAVRKIREWKSADHAPPEIRAQIPSNLEEIRAFFRNPPAREDIDVRPGPLRREEAIRFLCEERGFARERVERVLARLAGSYRMKMRLNDFAGAER